MSALDWLIDLLQEDFGAAEKKLMEIRMPRRDRILNVLAIKLLRKDYEDLIRIAEESLGESPNIHNDVTAKILEYRLIASILINDLQRVLDSLRKLRTKIFILPTPPTLFQRIGDWCDLLDEQKVFFVRRQILGRTIVDLPLSKSTIAFLSLYLRENLNISLQQNIKREFISYVAALMAHTPQASYALKLLSLKNIGEDDYNTLVARGKVFFALNQTAKALSEFNRAILLIKEKRGGLEALVNISQIYAMYGEYKLALEYVKRALLIRQDPLARLTRGIVLLNMGRFDEAILAFKALLRIESKRLKLLALLGLSECYVAKRNFRAAFDVAWRAYMLDQTDEIVGLYAYVLKNLSEQGRG